MDRRLRRALIATAVLLGLLVAADRISLSVAEGIAAKTIKNSQHLPSTPSVSVHGFPFLTQLAAGSYDEIDVTAHGLEVGEGVRPLRVSRVAVALHSVTIANHFRSVRAKRAAATATITYADLSTALGATVSYAGTGRVQASGGTTLAGVTLRGTISALAELNGQQLSFSHFTTAVNGAAEPTALNALLGRIFATPLSLAGLPFGLHYTGLEVTKSGIQLKLAGVDLVYFRG